jgi:ornithine--oxo-acid transaminase
MKMSQVDMMTRIKQGFSAESDDKIYKFESAFGANHYGRVKLVVRRARAQWLYNIDNRRYLDCLSAYSAVNQGHHHPAIVRAMISALEDNFASVVSNVVYTDSLGIFLNKLATAIKSSPKTAESNRSLQQ